ncbi:MAG: D-hexose-6-phosphate mutarotase [Burkholderiaceae bacterium]|nr:D-hexose-6-phosphate mutarotase [Burkholderiaceae bacterium]
MRKEFKGIAVTEVQSPDGAVAMAADHGAHLLSWTLPGGGNRLYLSETSQYGGDTAIRGGVPLIFPQFGARGNGKRHGIVRNIQWQLEFSGVEAGKGVLRYSLSSDASWQDRFKLQYEIVFDARELRLNFGIENRSDHAWQCCAALHTYFAVGAVDEVQVAGLHGLRYLDQPAGGVERTQHEELLTIAGETDRIYAAARDTLILRDGARELRIGKHGFEDVVVWNPGVEKAAGLADVVPGDAARFLCIEAGAILQPLQLAPGASWQGAQIVTV